MPTGYSESSSVAPTVQAAAYAAGQCVGAVSQFTGMVRGAGTGGLIQGITCTFASGVTPTLDAVIFTSALTTSTATDKTALAITAVDLPKVAGVMHLTDATSLGSTSVVQAQQQALNFDCPAGVAYVYVVIVARSAFTLTSTSDMTVTLQVLQN